MRGFIIMLALFVVTILGGYLVEEGNPWGYLIVGFVTVTLVWIFLALAYRGRS